MAVTRTRTRVEVKGDRLIIKRLKDLKGSVKLASGAATFGVGNAIMRLSKRKVPVDLGVLRGSGYVTLPDRKSNVEAGYGGPAKSYAVRQHEDTNIVHPGGGEAKFLEKAVNEVKPKALEIAARMIRKAVRLEPGQKINPVGPTGPNQGKKK